MKLTRFGKRLRRLVKEFDDAQPTKKEEKIIRLLLEAQKDKESRLKQLLQSDGIYWVMILILAYLLFSRILGDSKIDFENEPKEKTGFNFGGLSSMAMPFIISMMAKMRSQQQTEQETEEQPQEEKAVQSEDSNRDD